MIKLLMVFLIVFSFHNNVWGQSFPKFAGTIGGKESGQMRLGEFLAQNSVGGMYFIAGNHWERIPIDSFCIIIIRDTTVIDLIKNKGQIFTDDTIVRLKKLSVSDKLLIYDIYGRTHDGKVVLIRPLEIRIE